MTGRAGWGNIKRVKNIGVSVAIPCYNCAPWLGAALDSLLAQTRGDWEAIVVDDGSTDASAEVAAEYAARDGRIRLLRQPNGGVGSARNTGARAARGRWLVFLDADDLIHAEFIEAMAGVIEAAPDAIGSVCQFDLFDEKGTGAMRPLPGSGARVGLNDILGGSAWTIHAGMVGRELFEKIGGFDTALKNADDWDFWLRALVHGDFVAVRRTLAHYRQHPAQKSRNFPRIAHHVRIVTDKFRRLFPEAVERFGAGRFREAALRQMIGYAWIARREGLDRQALKIHMEVLSMRPPLMIVGKIVQIWTPLWIINFYRRLRGLRPIRDRFANEQP